MHDRKIPLERTSEEIHQNRELRVQMTKYAEKYRNFDDPDNKVTTTTAEQARGLKIINYNHQFCTSSCREVLPPLDCDMYGRIVCTYTLRVRQKMSY